MATVESNVLEDIPIGRLSDSNRRPLSPSEMRPTRRAQTFGDIASFPGAGTQRRGSGLTTDSQERISMKSSMDDLLLPTSPTKAHEHGSSHFHSTPLLFAILPALGGILFEGGSVVLTDICIIALSCIFLNWSLRLPWDWYHSSQAIITEAEYAHQDYQTHEDTITEEDEDEVNGPDTKTTTDDKAPRNNTRETLTEYQTAIAELNRYQLIALVFCFAGPLLGAWLLHSIREQLSRPSEGLISNFNLGIFVLAAELRPTQHVFKLVQSRILYLQRTAAKNPFVTPDIDPVAIEDIRTRLNDLESHVTNTVQVQSSPSSDPTTIVELRKTIQPELDALNRAVRRYEKRAIALEMQVRAELQDHDQRIKDALALAAAVTRQKKSGLMAILDFGATIVVLPLQAVFALFATALEVPKAMLGSIYEMIEKRLGGWPAWLFPRRGQAKKPGRDASVRRKRRD